MTEFTETWNQYFDLIPAELQDLYFREEYVRLYETDKEKACCFVYQDGDSILLFPFLRPPRLSNGKGRGNILS